MTTIIRSALLPYRPEQVFALVNDIESYPQFMDGCVGSQILRSEAGIIEARLDLARAGIRQSFATRNTLQPHHTIELELLEGPFERFTGVWQFIELGDTACKVNLELEFYFNNSVLGAAAGKLFDSVSGGLVDSVGKRARQIYG
ncbi:type II toxin-antitoxin system RatA family toxin [Halieaceae bacterium IMCC14734]|uniref:Type II toxin-antitoxin system RatA family toxin n=1 Tax=Candidatus Litorirhabdus singularis TaxID=2518993 RepID=A0ABT3TLW7_9GAMM|nr:type II toxin-antitoxin system RatA family toxin [Candidatus Litorirhabdus singularis]MCX2983288.1 type II toxin-antitoxin system RatA family toxin [Candidatus Litorirhabdus singularis]